LSATGGRRQGVELKKTVQVYEAPAWQGERGIKSDLSNGQDAQALSGH